MLAHGAFGALVQVGDPEALAQAVIDALGTAHDRERLVSRGLEFSVESSVSQYERLMFS